MHVGYWFGKSHQTLTILHNPKARLVLVGWQDPELGRIKTDSPTLRKESKNLILSICAAKKWKIWGADIKTAFLSGDPSDRQLYFRPPDEIKSWMKLDRDQLFRLEKAAYGLAEAPRAWFLRLSRELSEQGLQVSQLDRCLFTLRNKKGELIGICGVHVDDLLGGGTPEMDRVLDSLKKKLLLEITVHSPSGIPGLKSVRTPILMR